MPGEVNLTVSLNKMCLPVTGTRQLGYVLIEAAPSQAMETVQMPLNLSLVLDKSGSTPTTMSRLSSLTTPPQ
jgi:Ca-activated chloride channel family protein